MVELILYYMYIYLSIFSLSSLFITLFPFSLSSSLLVITCVVLCNDDDYKRCLVESLLEPSYAYIQLIDYGHSEMVSFKRYSKCLIIIIPVVAFHYLSNCCHDNAVATFTSLHLHCYHSNTMTTVAWQHLSNCYHDNLISSFA